MIKGFKEFVMRGNVVELAVAVVMGAAMTALVGSFGDAFLNPLITLVTGGAEVGGSFTVNGVEFPYGVFLNGVLVFFLTSVAVYFVIVLPMNKLRERFTPPAQVAAEAAEEHAVAEIEVLQEIRDLLREQNRR
ncbi:large conductance mechanosensitive channel protein MscL [Glycomyces sp. TRM65418]|uniref:large conductance mechanosensitive channel protein MscL n=1 Tax=Glycomyces sp. TRM65418 TaxID=2867006 RepID=UPI001CE537D8|nr:large conductance mechanosensitive channel protein MscL [Glycomyces sp. TRM65418]MCC3765762.1 large conductance mechanosensitive channel protein MscL [Glycomyces sp. TRM65418]QZD55352.1 large conductance mechanosensitive channel protein MscL [Glycomyces sp. TRM65418]